MIEDEIEGLRKVAVAHLEGLRRLVEHLVPLEQRGYVLADWPNLSKPEWRPIDPPPQPGQEVLLHVMPRSPLALGRAGFYSIVRYRAGGDRWPVNASDHIVRWMPLPPPPEGPGNG